MESLGIKPKVNQIARHLSGLVVSDHGLNADNLGGMRSPNGGQNSKGKTFGTKKSSFSKKSSRSADFDEMEQLEKKESENEGSYLHKIKGDFDRRKNYEETVL